MSTSLEDKMLTTTPDPSPEVWAARVAAVLSVLSGNSDELSKEKMVDTIESLIALCPGSVLVNAALGVALAKAQGGL